MRSSTAEKARDSFSEESYDTNLITGALLWSDMKKLAGLLLSGTTAAELRSLVLQDNFLVRKSTKRSLNLLSYLLQRLSLSTSPLLELIANGDSISSRQAAFLCSLQNSRFLREFLFNIVCDKLESFHNHLPPLFWEDFWNACVSKDHALQTLRQKAISELRSVLIQFLVEVEILDSLRSRELKHIRFTPSAAKVLKTAELSWLTPCVRSFVR